VCGHGWGSIGGRNRESRSVYPRDGAPRSVSRHLRETMKPLRWFLIALAAGCAGILAAPLTASAATSAASAPHVASARNTTAVAAHTATTPRHRHRHFGRHATPRLSRLAHAVPASRTGHRLPLPSPANRSKAHHASLSSSRGRGHSVYGILPHAPNAAPDDRYGALRVGAMDDPGARLNRMLESRGPPRAGPHWIPAHRGSYLPLPRTSPAPNFSHLDNAHAAPRAAVPCPAVSSPTFSTWSASWDPVLPSVFEGAAAGHDMPSSGGVTS
jgi:hypothetical protein